MKKLWSLVSLVLIATMVLAACATPAATTEAPVAVEPTQAPAATEAPKPTEAPAATEAPTAVPPTEAPAAPVATLKIWADETRAAILQKVGERFLAENNVEVIVENVTGIRDQFLIAAPAGEGPDIIIVAHDQAGTLVANGLLAPIDLGEKADAFVQPAVDAFTFDGQLYGMPYATENLAFFYNTALVAEPPATWEDVFAVGKALQDEGKVTYCMSMSGTTYDIYPFFTAYGGYVFGKNDQGNYDPQDVGLDNEGMIEAVTLLDEQVKNGCLSQSTDWDTAHKLFETGETPFIMAGPWALGRIISSTVPYAITNFPGGGYPFLGVQGFLINAKSENILLAQAFLTEFVATDEVMTELYESNDRPSAFKTTLEKSSDPDLLAFGVAGAAAQAMPAIPEMGSVWTSWADGITLIFNQKQAPADAVKEGAAKIRDLIANPLTGMVNVPGSYQAQAGCEGDWNPACKVTAMAKNADGTAWVSGPFKLTAGDYEVKVALDGGWATNYGADGKKDGDNVKFNLAADSEVSFSWDPTTFVLTVTTK